MLVDSVFKNCYCKIVILLPNTNISCLLFLIKFGFLILNYPNRTLSFLYLYHLLPSLINGSPLSYLHPQ